MTVSSETLASGRTGWALGPTTVQVVARLKASALDEKQLVPLSMGSATFCEILRGRCHAKNVELVQ